jgi:ParB/RepB/Spo0J family partition protein
MEGSRVTQSFLPELKLINVDELKPSPSNPRSDLGDLEGLTASIKADGILMPLGARELPDGSYELAHGHRRLAAAKAAGLANVPVEIMAVNDTEHATILLIENLHRQDLAPLDKATGFQRLVDLGLTQREIAKKVGVSQAAVSKHLALLKLPDAAKEQVAAGELSQEDAVTLAGLPADLQDKALNGPGVAWAKRRHEERLHDELTLAKLRKDAVPIFDTIEALPADATRRSEMYWLSRSEIEEHDSAPCRAVLVDDHRIVEWCLHTENHPRPKAKPIPRDKQISKEGAEALAKREEVLKLRGELREAGERRREWLAGLKGTEPGLATTAVGFLLGLQELLVDEHMIADALGDPQSEESAEETITRHASSAAGALRILFLAMALDTDRAIFDDQYGIEFEIDEYGKKAGLKYMRGLVALGYAPSAIERRFLGLSEPATVPELPVDEPVVTEVPTISVEAKRDKYFITCSECGHVGFNTKPDTAEQRGKIHLQTEHGRAA